jgi:hypothetical protein
MAFRVKITARDITVAGSTVAHGLGAVPDQVQVMPTLAAGAGQTYRFSTSDATNVYLAQGTAGTSADVVISIWHSIIK